MNISIYIYNNDNKEKNDSLGIKNLEEKRIIDLHLRTAYSIDSWYYDDVFKEIVFFANGEQYVSPSSEELITIFEGLF